MAEETLRVLLVDDHPMMREGLSALLATVPGTIIVGECGDGESAVKMALDLQPALILMDLNLPKLSGIEATRRITPGQPADRDPGPHDARGRRLGLRRDARGGAWLSAQRRGKEEVIRAINVVAAGEAIFSPPIAQRLVQYFANMRPLIPANAFPELTEREREVLALIVDGKSNAQIAEMLSLSPKTVSNHISNIFSKLQVLDRAQAVTKARRMSEEE